MQANDRHRFSCTDNAHQAILMAMGQVQAPKRVAGGWRIETWNQSRLCWEPSTLLDSPREALYWMRATRYQRAAQLLGMPEQAGADFSSWPQRLQLEFAEYNARRAATAARTVPVEAAC